MDPISALEAWADDANLNERIFVLQTIAEDHLKCARLEVELALEEARLSHDRLESAKRTLLEACDMFERAARYRAQLEK